MANEKTQANIGFEKQLWDAACVLWGHMPIMMRVCFIPSKMKITRLPLM